MKKNNWNKLLTSVLLSAVLISACAQLPNSNAKAENVNIRTLSVSGSGQITLVPDLARINVGVNSQAKDVTTAVNENNKQAQAITDALKKMGIDEKDIQTANFNVYPQQRWDPETNMDVRTGYSVDNTLYITVRDLKSLSKVLDAAINAGANQIYGISFDISDRQAAQDQARDLALKDAEEKAKSVAKAVGVTLGEVYSINVSNNSYVQPYFGMGGGGLVKDMAMDASVPVSAGQIVVSYDVNLIYTIQ